MSLVQFQCPSCQAPLRLQNRALFVGRTFDCPDCGETLLIEADGSSGVKARPMPSSKTATIASHAPASLTRRTVEEVKSSKVSNLGVSLPPRLSAWDKLSRRPAVLGWIVAALFAVLLLVVVNPGSERTAPLADPPIIAKSHSKTASQDEAHPTKSSKQESKNVADPDPLLADADTAKTDAKPGLPLSLEPPVAVEPPRDEKPKPEHIRTEEKPPVADPKPDVPPAPAPLTPEAVEAKLQQKIARFEQPKPVAFVKLLDTVEELAGIPIVWDLDRVDEQQLQKPVTLHLKQTTVAEILDTLLKQVGLERRTIDGKIELRPPIQKD